jgi:unsaturated rhamnogalacturonyl hydrolase
MPLQWARVLVACGMIAGLGGVMLAAQSADSRKPLDIARVLAMRYPASPIMSYIPALSWSAALRLSRLTGDRSFADKARREMAPFLTGEKPAIAEPYLLTSLAGHLAFADLTTLAGDPAGLKLARAGADFILPDFSTKGSGLINETATPAAKSAAGAADSDTIVRFPRRWTDDMFMASSVLSRVGAQTNDPRYATAAGRLLTSYAERLQRPDGLFIHAVEGPHAWGRGNGFAVLGLADALQFLPPTWPDRARVLDIYRRHVRAMLPHQSDDGSWRQVVDEPTSYKELTVTAMTVAAMARGLRLGWIDKSFAPIIERAWRAVAARVGLDGSVADVCSGTGAGPTKEYYLNRPAVSGGDDRGGAMALLAALEVAELMQ